MTTAHQGPSSMNDVRLPDTVAQAEAAWLVAITKGDEEQRHLMLPDCVIVHGPVGNVHDRERFLSYNASMGPTVEAETSEVACLERGGRAIVTCFQKMRIRRLPDLPPFLVQAVATRVWFSTDEGWRLGHMQLSRRQPPA
ncbi:nuclear transport factor 2 family protein [Streptomyces sp. PSKA54]|uniref:Nuclear transport factor 2 family protein n=1 Tax=Streptomyces himalayensis subsp. aureolus TaxID=2758039 RepID=A0A7W2HJ14_9ACTN|nr:nuclear transport factor 2 family protein [Streptomyces himalayensis]MBA4865394.1 nuclear transport factor 2 family protein [Streptomyces himalayensis subsp. aureolus]